MKKRSPLRMTLSGLSRCTSRSRPFRPGLWSFSCRSSLHRKFVSSCWGCRRKEALRSLWSFPPLPLINFSVVSMCRLPSRWSPQSFSIEEETLGQKADKEATQPQHQGGLLTLRGLSAWCLRSSTGLSLTFLRFCVARSFTCIDHRRISAG